MARIISPSIQATVQDYYGRRGFMDIGIAYSGFMDNLAGRLVNQVIGNDINAPAIEITGGGFEIEFQEKSIIAIGGSDIKASINGNYIEHYKAVEVNPGDILKTDRISAATKGFRQYLAVAGGVMVDEYLGSHATAVYGGFGGFNGRNLKAGDVLETGTVSEDNKASAGRKLSSECIPVLTDTWTFRAIPGPDAAPDFITEEGMEEIYNTEYRAQMYCDRSGIRLKGPAPKWNADRMSAGGHPSNITDHGYPCPGGVNISGDTLIMFTCESPTSGGLICALSVIEEDLWKMGQIFPGRDKIRFKYCDVKEAVELKKTDVPLSFE